MRSFWVADFSAGGDLLQVEPYENALLEQVPGAAELIGEISGRLYRSPDAFRLDLLGGSMRLEWGACSPTGGIASLRFADASAVAGAGAGGGTGDSSGCAPEDAAGGRWALATFALLLSGLNPADDEAICAAAQDRLVQGLRDTGFEPAFDLRRVARRPLVASFNGISPASPAQRGVAALCDRCLGAAYFRQRRLV